MIKKIIILSICSAWILTAQQQQKLPASHMSAGRLLDVVTIIKPVQQIIKDYLNVHDQFACNMGDLPQPRQSSKVMAFAPDGSKIAYGITITSASPTNPSRTSIYFYDLKLHQRYLVYEEIIYPPRDWHTWITALTFSPDGKKLACAHGSSNIRIFACQKDLSGEDILGELAAERIDHAEILPNGGAAFITSLAYSPCGAYLACGGLKQDSPFEAAINFVAIFGMKIKGQIYRCQDFNDSVRSLSYAPDGKYLAIAQNTNTVQILDTQKFEFAKKIADGKDNKMIWAVAYAHHGSYLAMGGDSKVVKICDLAKNKCVYKKTYTDVVYQIAYSPDKRYFALNLSNRPIELFTNQAVEMTRADEQAERENNANSQPALSALDAEIAQESSAANRCKQLSSCTIL